MAATVAVVVVALLHLWFCVLEAFFWTRPLGLKVFKLRPEQAQDSKVLAQNQGLYNAFLAAGLLWGLSPWTLDPLGVQTFFLGCVVVAGLVGGLTAGKGILVVQLLPGVVALVLVRLAA